MLAYAANRRSAVERRSSPQAMLVVAVAHVAVIAVVMSAKMDLPTRVRDAVTRVDLIELPKPPPPPEPQPRIQPKAAPSVVDRVVPLVPVPEPRADTLDPTPLPLPPIGADIVGPPVLPQPRVHSIPVPAPVRVGPRFATPDHLLRPPYPPSKIEGGEEASLRLRLAIDERGRVTSVEPAGRADPAFLEAARRHLLAKWRYKPATEDGRPVASTTVITLRFELE